MTASEKRLFLTPPEAIKAICADFQQYEPQLMLFSEILRLLTDGKQHLKRDSGRTGAWINTGTHYNMQWLEGPELTAHMCTAVTNAPLDLDKMAAICSRVFQTRVTIGRDPESRRMGLLIETGMADYVCRQCGHCCRTLDYHHEATTADVQYWRANNRKNILEWVSHYQDQGQNRCRIWVRQSTGRLETPCPFLKKHPSQNRWMCRIHADKPTICRDYPVSRKHARMTGCPGWQR